MGQRNRLLAVFGTRPEAIKMAPLIRAFQERSDRLELRICVTGQHRTMLDQVLEFFGIRADYDLDLMRPDQGLGDISAAVLAGARPILESWRPDRVLVQGDTVTAFAAALAAFHARIPVDHVEAGLRTGDPASPWPEEINRRLISVMADLHFAPTSRARDNLLREGIDPRRIHLTGNTVVDALGLALGRIRGDPALLARLDERFRFLDRGRRLILVTGHRRENLGATFAGVCSAFRRVVAENPGVELVFPVHLNPNVRRPVREILGSIGGIHLLDPVDYPSFVYLMDRAHLIITDSGGIQEEAPSLGKPVLLTRDCTERPEGVRAGCVLLVGTRPEDILEAAHGLLRDPLRYERHARVENPYGDGRASERIVKALENVLEGTPSDRPPVLDRPPLSDRKDSAAQPGLRSQPPESISSPEDRELS